MYCYSKELWEAGTRNSGYGTGCQGTGLKKYLGKPDEKLLCGFDLSWESHLRWYGEII